MRLHDAKLLNFHVFFLYCVAEEKPSSLPFSKHWLFFFFFWLLLRYGNVILLVGIRISVL